MFYKKNKYGNKKIIFNDIKFDSKLELYCYKLLNEMDISFSFQEKIILVDKFRYNNKTIRAITLTVDFVIKNSEKTIYLDTKGFATEVAKIKYKMLKNKLKEDPSTEVVWLNTQKNVKQFIINLKNKENGNN
tara:strand:- start:869 stop:1264 length:396 start_codon:yes stop_codon:yes gene_type:complete